MIHYQNLQIFKTFLLKKTLNESSIGTVKSLIQKNKYSKLTVAWGMGSKFINSAEQNFKKNAQYVLFIVLKENNKMCIDIYVSSFI